MVSVLTNLILIKKRRFWLRFGLYFFFFFNVFRLQFIGLLRVVNGIQQLHTDCQTLNTIYSKNLSIKCNKDKVVYVINQLSINSLGKNSTTITGNNAECQNTTNSTCFRSITSDLSPAFTSKIARYCNGNHSCTLEFSDLNSSARIFTNSCRCCTGHLYHIRIGVSFECLPCKYFVNIMDCFSTDANYYHTNINIPLTLLYESLNWYWLIVKYLTSIVI